GEAAGYRGIIDLLAMQAYLLDGNGPQDIPAEQAEAAQFWRAQLVEAVAATDDELTLKYLEDEPLSLEEITAALRQGVASCQVCPVLAGSALMGSHWPGVLQYLRDLVPSPADTGTIAARDLKGEPLDLKPSDSQPSALVFKTLADPYVGRVTLFRVFSGTVP